MAMLQAFRGNAHHARGAGILASAMTWRRREGNRRPENGARRFFSHIFTAPAISARAAGPPRHLPVRTFAR
jgi:hypothetical protein